MLVLNDYQYRRGLLVLLLLFIATLIGAGDTLAATISLPRYWQPLFGVAIVPGGRSYIVGAKGLLLESTDEGISWRRRMLTQRSATERGEDLDLYSIRFAKNSDVGWIVGEHGSIFRTNDSGQTWVSQTSGETADLFKIAVLGSQQACAVGSDGIILCTHDAGEHWHVQHFKRSDLYDITFADKLDGWIVGDYGSILHTSDGGKTWTTQAGGNTFTLTPTSYFAVAFQNDRQGWTAGLSGALATTSDGGGSWRTSVLPGQVSMYCAAIAPTGVFMAGDNGVIAYNQGDAHWSSRPQTAAAKLTDIAVSRTFDLVVGLDGTVLRSTDGGETWKTVGAK